VPTSIVTLRGSRRFVPIWIGRWNLLRVAPIAGWGRLSNVTDKHKTAKEAGESYVAVSETS
jgi:hypothetical protein